MQQVVKYFFHLLILLLTAGGFSSCRQEDSKREEKAPCDPWSLLCQYPNTGGNPPWMYEVIDEWLENGTHGRITQCEYIDGIGYLLELLDNGIGTGCSFRTCDGTIVYEGEENPIEGNYLNLNIKIKKFLLGIYPSWEQGQEWMSDEFLCHAINPFTLPRVKEMLYGCDHHSCYKRVSICTYRDGVGFLLWEHLNAGINANWEFLDCCGNLLCSKNQVNSFSFPPEFNIDVKNEKLLFISFISLNFN